LALAAGFNRIIAAYELNYSRAANEVAAWQRIAERGDARVCRRWRNRDWEFALEKRIPLKYEEIPPVMKNAILAVEDARFYDHVGIDPIRIIGATWKNLTSDKVEGGSTLTQQLAKNLFFPRTNAQTKDERVGAGSSNRTLLHEEPNHGAVCESHVSSGQLIRVGARKM